jgi:hypothetical protein
MEKQGTKRLGTFPQEEKQPQAAGRGFRKWKKGILPARWHFRKWKKDD